MFDSPQPLKDYCMDFIRESVKDALASPEESEAPKDASNMLISNLFANRLTAGLTEQLLESLSEDEKLSDNVLLEVFKAENCSLENVRIPNASTLSLKGLRVLRGHLIKHLEVVGLTKVTINELISCLGEYTLNNLMTLNVAHCSFTSTSKFCVVVALAKLQNLRSLDVSHTEFNYHGLEIVVEDLPALQSLNISGTRVRDLSPLRKCKGRLKCLSMYNLRPPNPAGDFMSVILELTNLIKLDVSDDRDHPLDTLTPSSDSVTTLINSPYLFPNLKYLDISGREGVSAPALRNFINLKHQLGTASRMTFLGLMQTDLCTDEAFIRGTDDVVKDIVVTGSATEKQILESLHRYLDRPAYIQKTLCYLYNYTINCEEPRLEVIQLILPTMKKHAKVISIQMAATACLYNLTKGKVGERIHPKWLGNVVSSTLNAMENFPSHQQLQKNTLLTLCSDRILQEVSFDRFRCTKLVMESLVNFSDNSMNRMAVAICSILAAKISTSETSFLGARPLYMETLLQIVRSRLSQSNEPDIMLKFTLSALWNLTDESPRTCSMFLEKGGINLYLEVLNTYTGHNAVETKILGLLNNIAEVRTLRGGLLSQEFVSSLRSLLHSAHIDVSYFAAGIFAHLLSDGPDVWTCAEIAREHVVRDLMEVVLAWKAPDVEMVAYRSFSPFLPLLGCHGTPEVQLWAVWAIHHVCSKNPKRYCEMLLENGTFALFKSVRAHAEANDYKSLNEYCCRTLEVMRNEYPQLATESF